MIDASRREARTSIESTGGRVLEEAVDTQLDAALVACPVDERLGESLPDACPAGIATHIHASQDTKDDRLTSRARRRCVPNDVADDCAVTSSDQDHRAVVDEQPLEVGRSLSQRPRHIRMGIMHPGVFREEERFEFDERFNVTLIRDFHARHRPHRTEGREAAVHRFPCSAVAGTMCRRTSAASSAMPWTSAVTMRVDLLRRPVTHPCRPERRSGATARRADAVSVAVAAGCVSCLPAPPRRRRRYNDEPLTRARVRCDPTALSTR